MKKLIALLLSLLAFVANAYTASMPAIGVIVSDAKGKVAYQGTTNAQGTFSTPNLAPGSYVVQFNSKNAALKGKQYALVISAGKKKVTADAVAGDKLTAGGVAMKVDVGPGLNIAGQIANGQMGQSDPNVKIIKGKRFVWVKGGETGSNLGGRWVEEGSPDARNVRSMSTDAIRARQDHGDVHQEGFPSGR